MVSRLRDNHLTRHIQEARIEDARFMIENGESMERAAVRLGVTTDALEKMLQRKC